jgi:hypothetical protein
VALRITALLMRLVEAVCNRFSISHKPDQSQTNCVVPQMSTSRQPASATAAATGDPEGESFPVDIGGASSEELRVISIVSSQISTWSQ